MNFMSGGRPSGFYEAEITAGSTNSSSLQQRNNLYTYRHHDPYGGPPQDTTNGDDSDDHIPGSSSAAAAPSIVEKEHMFDKVVTPSDVGKLNRLVIPKQHAEKYFPLDSSANEKGLLLNFEDRNGKPWRFRYSYWNSSQSYVMTKGWSRFVKEKKLDAGDIVSFQRGVGDKDRLFIDWRRRPDAPPELPVTNHFFSRSPLHPWNSSPLFLQPVMTRDNYPKTNFSAHQYTHYPTTYNASSYPTTVVNGNPCVPGSIMYLRSTGGGGSGFVQRGSTVDEQMVFDSVPVVQGKAAAKRLRLFGVNMDCPINSESSDECDINILSSTTLPHSTSPPVHHHLSFESSAPSSIPYLQLRPNYNRGDDDDKGKRSMSLDFDI